jgi:2-methylisocitrate lyase-like PEP mutase family enzyme
MNNIQSSAVATFRSLHESGCFVLPNPWDPGTARYLAHLGFKALATTSAGFAFSRGLPDRVSAITTEKMLSHFREIAEATPLPVNADFQNGYADRPEDVMANVTRCIGTGVAGLSIEDSTGKADAPLYERELAIERVRAARAAIDDSDIPVVFTARCEVWLTGDPDARQIALDRLVAYADEGADCLYAPGVRQPEDIAAIVKAVSPKPVNVLMSSPGLTLAQLGDLGVRRISVGSALARVAWGAFIHASQSIAESGTFDSLSGMSLVNLNQLFAQRESS